MSDKTILLENIDPLEILGINNTKLERLKNFFSKLKIISRGDEIRVIGEPDEIKRFEHRIELLIQHYHQYNQITNADLEQIILGEYNEEGLKKEATDEVLLFGNNGRIIRARTENQFKMVQAAQDNDLILAIGPAGTGKTYTAIALAVRALKNRQVKKIVLSRPAVEAGENLGFLPGDMKEKIDPYLQPLYDALGDMIPPKKLKDFIEEGIIQIAPLAFMRGRTLENAFVILDEAQNATINQFKMFVTRMGMQAKFIITGDITQIDLPRRTPSGLVHATKVLKNISGMSIIEFNQQDIVRHPLVRQIVAAYEKSQEIEKNN